MHTLRLTSCMAPNMDFIGREIAEYAAGRLGMPVEFVADIPWQARERQFDEGEIHACWICGLPYVWKADEAQPAVELLAAPVMAGERYGGKPVYFSDVVVRADSSYRSFSDLQGTTWAYNEPRSHSGYNITRHALASRGLPGGFFGKVIEAGSHQRALKLLLRKRIDASAIDSTVLELELQREPGLGQKLRVIETFGPSPIPPWVASTALPTEFRRALRELLLSLHEDPEGRAILQRGRMARFVRVADSDYNPIRSMAALAERVDL